LKETIKNSNSKILFHFIREYANLSPRIRHESDPSKKANVEANSSSELCSGAAEQQPPGCALHE